MFGFSIQKLVVLAAILAAVWYGFKWVKRLDQTRKDEARLRNTGKGRAGGGPVDEMVQCPVCDTYVASGATKSCGRPDCPY